MSEEKKTLVLGTALWGWGVDKKTAFELVDSFVSSGGKTVDAATNYPINGVAEDSGKALEWLAEWCQRNPQLALSILVKVGSLDNTGKPDFDLSPETIYRHEQRLRDLFEDRLSAISVHWDNRGAEDTDAIKETIGAMADINGRGLGIGFSGVKSPEIYLTAAPELASKWLIQVKENPMTRSSRIAYSQRFPSAKYFAYGINMGGVKDLVENAQASVALRGITIPEEIVGRISGYISRNKNICPSLVGVVEFSLALAVSNPHLSGLIIGPRNLSQLKHTIEFCRKISNDPSIYSELCNALNLNN